MNYEAVCIHLLSDILQKLVREQPEDKRKERNDRLNLMLLKLISFHRLEARISNTRLPIILHNQTLDPHFAASLMMEKRKTALRFEEQRGVIREIADAFRAKGMERMPIVIKGSSVFGLTGNPNHIRRSADIDLIYSDPEVLEAVLTDIGFTRDANYWSDSHEYCHMTRDHIIIDIHKYMPIIDYSAEINKKAEHAIARDSRIFFESSTNLVREELLYSHIVDSAQACEALGGMLVPDIHNQILIISAHIFKNFVHSAFRIPSEVKLAELLDIVDLMYHPLFHGEYMKTIAIQNQRLTCISFAGFLLKALFDDDRLNCIVGASERLYPKKLFWGGTMYVPQQIREYIHFDHGGFAQGFHAASVDLNRARVEVLTPDQQRYNSHGIRHVEAVTIENNASFVNVQIKCLHKPMISMHDTFDIVWDKTRYRFTCTHEAIDAEKVPTGWVIGRTDDEQKYTVTLSLPTDKWESEWKISTGLIMQVTRWGNGPLSTFIPVHFITQAKESADPMAGAYV